MADFPGSPGNFRGSQGNFRGSLGIFRGTSGLLFSSTVRELPGKSPKTSGEVRGTSGEVRGLSRSSGEPDSLPVTRQICLQVIAIVYFFSVFFFFLGRMPACAVKICAVRPVFARVVGELRAADPGKCPRAHEAKC